MSSIHLLNKVPMYARLLLLASLLMSMTGCFDDRSETPDVYKRIMDQKSVRIGVKKDTPPFGVQTKDGFVGFDIDIANALAKQMGIDKVEFVPVTSKDRIVKLLNGDVDMVIASMTITRYREHRVDFTLPYFQDGEALMVKRDSPISSYLDLAGKTVGCVKGSTSSYYMRQVAPNCTTKIYADYDAMMAGMAANEVDAATTDMLILLGLIKAAPDPTAYRIAGTRFTTEPYGIAIVQNQSHWRNALDDALQSLWENGRWQAICDSWFGPGAKYESQLDFGIKPYPH
jgi:polar amino acid transport system substrate-binding protein